MRSHSFPSLQDDAIHKLDTFASKCNEERERDSLIGEFIVLNRTRVDLSPTLTILGATLWSHLNPDNLDILLWRLTDLKRIKGFTADRFTELHKTELSWLNTQVEQIRANEQTRSVIIFTHHAPTMGTADPKYAGGPTESAFATELTNEPCWGPPVKVWAFGHTHWSCDMVKKGVRVVNNQRGYLRPGDKGWDPEFVLKV